LRPNWDVVPPSSRHDTPSVPGR